MLKESTQKRLLKIAGLEEYEAEVLSEMKEMVKKEKILKESSEKKMKKDSDEKKTKGNEEKTKEGKQVKLSEKPFPTEPEEGPVGDEPDFDGESDLDDESDLNSELGDEPLDVESGTDATVDFDAFAAEFAELLNKHAGASYAITKDGEPLSPVSESDFGSSELDGLDTGESDELDSGLGEEELPSEELEGPVPPSDPMKESKDVAKMVFAKVLEKLNKNYSPANSKKKR